MVRIIFKVKAMVARWEHHEKFLQSVCPEVEQRFMHWFESENVSRELRECQNIIANRPAVAVLDLPLVGFSRSVDG